MKKHTITQVEKQVKEFRQEFNVKGTPDIDKIKSIFEQLGFTLATYGESKDKLIELGEYEYSKTTPAFIVQLDKEHYVFYDETLSTSDVSFTLSHEIGHIYLNHLNETKGYYDTSEFKEREATNFACVLLSPQPKSKLWIVALLLIASLVFNIYFFVTQNGNSNTDAALDENTSAINTENKPQIADTPIVSNTTYVEVTKTGTKYHRKDCYTIKGRELTEITQAKAVDKGYEPCKICRPEILIE